MEKLQVIDSETLLNTPFPKQFFVVEGLIPQGLSVFCGQSKIGKSWLMLYTGLQVSQGCLSWDVIQTNAMSFTFASRILIQDFETECISYRIQVHLIYT